MFTRLRLFTQIRSTSYLTGSLTVQTVTARLHAEQ
jgi:hypothetical protein